VSCGLSGFSTALEEAAGTFFVDEVAGAIADAV
jgi:hypothetical protein